MPYRDHKNSLPIGKLFLCSLGGGCASRDTLTPVRFADTPLRNKFLFLLAVRQSEQVHSALTGCVGSGGYRLRFALGG